MLEFAAPGCFHFDPSLLAVEPVKDADNQSEHDPPDQVPEREENRYCTSENDPGNC